MSAAVDDVLLAILAKLNERRSRAIDLFRKIDVSGDGSVSPDEFFNGLADMGCRPSAEEFELLMQRLDRDGGGDVTLKEFDRALKAVEKKAKADGRLAGGTGGTLELPSLTPRATKQALETTMTPRLRAQEPVALQLADEFLISMIASLNERKTRKIDLFRFIDRSGDGSMSRAEFRAGLESLGFEVSGAEFAALVRKLDGDNSGDISISEFDRALKEVERAARRAGRADEIDTWHGKRDEKAFKATNWLTRSTENLPSPSTDSTWTAASGGPTATYLASGVGSGSIVDGSVFRPRGFDTLPSAGALSPTLRSPPLPTHKTVHRRAVENGRFDLEPTDLLHHGMRRSMRSCRTALRGHVSTTAMMVGGVRTFASSPMMQSTVDQVVFGRDMDFSGEEKFDREFTAMFDGSAGRPSWHYGR